MRVSGIVRDDQGFRICLKASPPLILVFTQENPVGPLGFIFLGGNPIVVNRRFGVGTFRDGVGQLTNAKNVGQSEKAWVWCAGYLGWVYCRSTTHLA
ncbi:MAG TPA: hypothetical protein P5055_16605 [Candidatus Paceibacterota bacterium]|nr:hypothetical protein [Candidatus Paceibacterota bacterium]